MPRLKLDTMLIYRLYIQEIFRISSREIIRSANSYPQRDFPSPIPRRPLTVPNLSFQTVTLGCPIVRTLCSTATLMNIGRFARIANRLRVKQISTSTRNRKFSRFQIFLTLYRLQLTTVVILVSSYTLIVITWLMNSLMRTETS